MRPDELNYRHLRYFWAVGKEGSITRAAERLGLSVQAVSTQIAQLERQLGQALLAPQGRSLVLTEAGRTALAHADQIFQAGDRLLHALAEAGQSRPRCAVGIGDAVPKLVAYRLLAPLVGPPLGARLECVEGEFDVLLSELALNRLDLVIADRSAPHRADLKLQSHPLGEASVALYGSAALCRAHGRDFPHGLSGAPLLLPTRKDPLRAAIDAWLEARDLRPAVVGEFTDSALLKTFGRAGLGLFPAPTAMEEDLLAQYAAAPLGVMDGVRERWYAIHKPRRIPHPGVSQILSSGSRLFDR